MTRTNLSIRFVLILATVIGIHGTIPDAIMTLKSDFEDGQADREFRVYYPGIVGSASATLKIFQAESKTAKVEYTVSNAGEPQLLHFELKEQDAPAGSYEVQVCLNEQECSARRVALGQILAEDKKPQLSCRRLEGKEENEFDRFSNNPNVRETLITINAGKTFLAPEFCGKLPAGSVLTPRSNPAYIQKKKVFYAVVSYDGKPLKDLFEQIASNGYCSRKYVFWASANVVHKVTKEVKRRYRGTHIVTQQLVEQYIRDSTAGDFPVEFARYDDEDLPKDDYYVSFSFCASDKDRANSSICSKAVYSEGLTFE